tara:strand:+ start:3483 stop:4910 length:1428 start_codon:yes stop_codon:yes gene_type:complete
MYRNSAIYIIVSLISVFSNFALLPFFTKYLNLQDYGVVALFIMYGGLSSSLFSFGMGQALNKFYFKYNFTDFKLIYSSVYFLLVFIFIALCLLIFIFDNKISIVFFTDINEKYILTISIVNGCILFLSTINKELIVNQKKPIIYSYLVLMQIVTNITTSVVLVYFFNLTYMGLIFGIFLSNILTLTVSILLNFKYFTFQISKKRLIETLNFSYPETPNIMIGLLFKSFDKIMLSNLKGSQSVGAYDIGQRFSSLIKILQDSIVYAWNPYFMEMAETKSSVALDKLKKFFQEINILFGILSVSLSFFAYELLLILTTPEFHSIKYLIPFLVIISYVQILSFIYTNQILFAGKLIYNLPISILSLSLNIILNIIMIPLYGVVGAVVATMISKLFNSSISLYFGNKAYPLNINLKRNLIIIICFTLLIFIIYPLMYYVESIMTLFFIKLSIILTICTITIYYDYINPKKIIFNILFKH